MRKFFESDTLVSIDAICFVANHNSTCLTGFEWYIYNAIISLFAKLIFLLWPPVVMMDLTKTMKCCNLQCWTYSENWRFLLLCIFYSTINIFLMNHIATCYCMDLVVWETSEISCSLFFDKLAKTYSVSLRLTLEVNQMQHNTDYIQIPMFVGKLQQ